MQKRQKMADLEEYGIRKLPKYKSGFERMLEDLSEAGVKAKQEWIQDEIGVEAYSILKEVKSAMDQKGIQARMPFILNVK